jgi:hypothetical protein
MTLSERAGQAIAADPARQNRPKIEPLSIAIRRYL